MSKRTTIALDAMGGDHAPDMVVHGAEIACVRHPGVDFRFYGPEDRLKVLVDARPGLASRVTIVDTPDSVAADAKPAIALRQGRQSSMRRAIDAVGEGEAACAVSAGNTGALMAMAKFVLKTMPGIERPAIASFFPTLRGESAMLDLGANIQVDADNLVQFAVMGEVFARVVLGIMQPTVGLLNVGSEELKGNEALRQAHALLSASNLPIRFHGFIEGDDIPTGTVDVIVTDGFSGNIALKTAEGTSKLIAEFVRQAFEHSLMAKIGYLFARGAMNKLRARVDPRRYNGAMFLGLNGIVVKSHGGTDATGFANAISVAVDMSEQNLIEMIREDFEALQTGHRTLTETDETGAPTADDASSATPQGAATS